MILQSTTEIVSLCSFQQLTNFISYFCCDLQMCHNSGLLLHCIDGENCGVANCMRYVNCARQEEEENLKAYQYKDRVY